MQNRFLSGAALLAVGAGATARRAVQIATLGAALGAAALPQAAWAHAHPVSSEPAVKASVEAPKQVRVTFDAALEGAFSRLSVADAKGKTVTTDKASLDAARKTLSVPLPTLAAGEYTVNWVAVASDGHRTQGNYTFTVK